MIDDSFTNTHVQDYRGKGFGLARLEVIRASRERKKSRVRIPHRQIEKMILLAMLGGPNGIRTHISDWLGRKRCIVLPERHLGKGIEKEGIVAFRKPLSW
jgi:hypothetical protein